ncbi:hypothetical protein M878_42850 [Streptomyces roseochromogenus subsp. oscitans DS 12.976]|uniref:Glucuronyl hydrolase n=2 Tax=Streptomyces roseochromogenus TaxID=285450 RepID=V6JGH1_STRRC|nr:hypothetical protein M878_42850 [Streptomyces roseochromogenus subsp. oscitans DS 12.976]
MSRRTVLAVAAGARATAASSAQAVAASGGQGSATAGPALRAAADYAVEKLRAVAPGVSAFPVGTKFEKWVFSQNGDWVGGFWPGTLWMAYLHSKDETFRTPALDSARKLAPRRYDTSTHDLGFLFHPSWVTAWRLTGDDSWRVGAIQAAGSLIQRYNSRDRIFVSTGCCRDGVFRTQ